LFDSRPPQRFRRDSSDTDRRRTRFRRSAGARSLRRYLLVRKGLWPGGRVAIAGSPPLPGSPNAIVGHTREPRHPPRACRLERSARSVVGTVVRASDWRWRCTRGFTRPPRRRRGLTKKLGATRLRRPRHTRTMAPGTQEVLLRYEAARAHVVMAVERAEWAIEDAKRFLAQMSAHAQKRRPRRDGSGRVVT